MIGDMEALDDEDPETLASKLTTTLTVRVSEGLKAQVVARAAAKRRSVGEWVRLVLEETLATLAAAGR